MRDVHAQDGLTDYADDEQERMDTTLRLINSFSEPNSSFALDDYWRLQDTMTAWYGAGKLDATGHAKGILPGDDLSHHCETIKFTDPADRVGYLKVTSNKYGVQQIEVQTVS